MADRRWSRVSSSNVGWFASTVSTDRTAAEKLTNSILLAEPLDDDDDDALWVHELIGARVVDLQGIERGVCVAVIDNPAHDLLELDNGFLIPVIFVVSCTDGTAIVDPPDGLFDL